MEDSVAAKRSRLQEILAQTRHIARPFTATIATNTGLAPTGYTPATPRNLPPRRWTHHPTHQHPAGPTLTETS